MKLKIMMRRSLTLLPTLKLRLKKTKKPRTWNLHSLCHSLKIMISSPTKLFLSPSNSKTKNPSKKSEVPKSTGKKAKTSPKRKSKRSKSIRKQVKPELSSKLLTPIPSSISSKIKKFLLMGKKTLRMRMTIEIRLMRSNKQ